MRLSTRWMIGPLALALTIGCKSRAEKQPAPPVTSSSAVARLPAPVRHKWPAPSGPILAVLAGQGVGPIRIGATTATIERLMEAPCEIKTVDVCRYPGRGVEFLLENGVTKTIHVYRAGRPAGKDQAGQSAEYGFFRGAIPPDLQLGMVPAAIQERLGQAQSVERRDVTGPGENVETHHYPGLTILYDRLENGNLVMAEMIVFKPAAADAGASASGGALGMSARPAPSSKR